MEPEILNLQKTALDRFDSAELVRVSRQEESEKERVRALRSTEDEFNATVADVENLLHQVESEYNAARTALERVRMSHFLTAGTVSALPQDTRLDSRAHLASAVPHARATKEQLNARIAEWQQAKFIHERLMQIVVGLILVSVVLVLGFVIIQYVLPRLPSFFP